MQRWFKLEATLFKLLSNFVFRMENVDLANFIPSQIQLDGVSRKNARYFISYVLQSQASYNEVQAENLAGLWTADGSYLKKTTLEEFSHIWNSNMLGVYLFRAVQETIGAQPIRQDSGPTTTILTTAAPRTPLRPIPAEIGYISEGISIAHALWGL